MPPPPVPARRRILRLGAGGSRGPAGLGVCFGVETILHRLGVESCQGADHAEVARAYPAGINAPCGVVQRMGKDSVPEVSLGREGYRSASSAPNGFASTGLPAETFDRAAGVRPNSAKSDCACRMASLRIPTSGRALTSLSPLVAVVQ